MENPIENTGQKAGKGTPLLRSPGAKSTTNLNSEFLNLSSEQD